MTAPEPRCLTAALEYVQRGFSVVLVHPKKKHPIGKWKHRQHHPATEAELREAFRRNPTANVGIVTGAISGIVVLDMDGEAGAMSARQLEGLEKTKAPVVKTGHGCHGYFRHPGHKAGNFASALPGLDGRGDGGFVVAPPSVHENGKKYEWLEGLSLSDVDPPEMPASVLALFPHEEQQNTQESEANQAMSFADAPTQRGHHYPADSEPIERYVGEALRA